MKPGGLTLPFAEIAIKLCLNLQNVKNMACLVVGQYDFHRWLAVQIPDDLGLHALPVFLSNSADLFFKVGF